MILLARNSGEVRVDFLFTDVTVSLWLALAVAGILGFAAGWLIGRFDLGPGRMNRQG